jgi:energy-coupling factor transporter ATP-binding protein EcfA2
VRLGDYLLVVENNKSLVLQVFDENYFDIDGIEEEVAREEILLTSTKGVTVDPADMSSISRAIRDMRLLHCKVRGSVERGRFTPRNDWVPSRTLSKVTKLNINALMNIAGISGARKIKIGNAGGLTFSVQAEAFDGKITIITGRKESGKSHLAKIIFRGLVEHGAYGLIFDLNDEYGYIGLKSDNTRTSVASNIHVLKPGKDFKFGLANLGLRAVVSLLQHSLEMPGTSIREFIRIWESMQARGAVTLKALGDQIQQWRCNEFVRDALYARFHTLLTSGLFTDSTAEEFDLNSFFHSHPDGGLLIISLSRVSPLNRRMTVELILSKLIESLEHKLIPPVFLLAEEAHLYLRETYWEDLITRMRHFGVFTTFVTNQPDAIGQDIYRQADNIFLYNFSNDTDLALVSQASMVDADTIRAIIKTLPPRMCLVLGHIVNNLPILVSVDPFDSPSSGVTRRFFNDAKITIPLTR